MPTIQSINFNLPEGWHDLGDKQLCYVYQLFAEDFNSDEVKTLCLLRWSGTKVIGRQDNSSYLLKRGKIIFEVTPLTLAELLPSLDWLASLKDWSSRKYFASVMNIQEFYADSLGQ